MKNLLSELNNLSILSRLLESPVATQKDVSAMKEGNVNVDQVIEKLNTIRSGKSFKDDQIRASLEQYFKSLKSPERVALLAFLKGIAQIVTGEVVGDKAVEPSDPAPSVTMKKADYRRVIKPVIIKKSTKKEQGKSAAAGEDVTPPTPAPIKPKK